MRRLSLLPSRRIDTDASIVSLYARAAGSWQDGLARIGYSAAYDALCRRAQNTLPLTKAATGVARILDAGAGTGALAAAFLQSAQVPCRVDLLDLSPDMLERAKQSLPIGCRAIIGAIGTPDLSRERYDRVLCGHAIEHCQDPQAALDWLYGRVAPGGMAVFAISRPHWCTALVRWKYGSAAFEPDLVEDMLRRAGFARTQRLPHDSGPPSRISCGYLGFRD